MNATATGSVLRPLGIGEILDRAVNLCVRNFLPLSIIYVVFMVPFAFVQYYATKDLSTMLQAFADASKSGSSDPSAVLRELGPNTGPSPLVIILTLVLLVLSPLPAAALIAAVSAFYFGSSTTFAQAYREGWARYAQLVGVTLLFVVAGGALYFGAVLVLVVLFFAVGFLYTAAPTVAIVIGVIIGTIALIVIVAFVMLALLATQLSYVTCVVERANFAVAFTQSIRRVFTGAGLRRSFIVGLAYFAISIGIAIVGAVGQGLFIGLLHVPLLGVAYAAIVRVVSASFTTAFVVIYYYDLRVREEGLDLQLAAAAQIEAPVASPIEAPLELPPSA